MTPGDHILFSGAFGCDFATHHSIYLGFIAKRDAATMSTHLRSLLKQTVSSLESGTDAACVAAFKDEFFRSSRHVLGGGTTKEAGVDLVLEIGFDDNLRMRALVMSMQRWAFNAKLVRGLGFVMRDSRMDKYSLVAGTDVKAWMHRALCCIGSLDYKVSKLNCEHMAVFVGTGVMESTQVNIADRTKAALRTSPSRLDRMIMRVPILSTALVAWRAKDELGQRLRFAKPKEEVDSVIGAALGQPLNKAEAAV